MPGLVVVPGRVFHGEVEVVNPDEVATGPDDGVDDAADVPDVSYPGRDLVGDLVAGNDLLLGPVVPARPLADTEILRLDVFLLEAAFSQGRHHAVHGPGCFGLGRGDGRLLGFHPH